MRLPILTTKLYAPAPPAAGVERPRLLAQLDRALTRKLTLISAPAGFGKTTLVATWHAHLQDAHADQGEPPVLRAWLALDEADNDPSLFLTYLVAALQTVDENLGASVQALLQSPQPPNPRTALAALINELAAYPQRIVLVLDDYHHITDRTLHEAIAYLLGHLPPTLHLIIATRADPPLPLARWRVGQEMTEIRAADLRFTAQEAATFLQQIWQINIAPHQVSALEARTEGWIAGLQLAALSLQRLNSPGDIDRFVADFTGSHRFVLDYLADEVLQQLPAPTLEFLLRTSILEELCADLCNVLLDQHDSQTVLEDLESANLFLVPLDEQRQWYRYHHLFRDLLRHRLKQNSADQIPQLHSTAAAWFADHQLFSRAIDHALAAGDPARAAQWIEATRWEVYSRGEIATLNRRLRALPDHIIDSTGALALTQVWTLLHAGKLDEVAAYVARIIPGLDLAEPLDDRVPASWRGELGLLQAQIAINRSQAELGRDYCLQARAHIPPDNKILHSIAEFFLGHSYRLTGDLAASIASYGRAAELGEAIGNRFLHVTALHGQGTIYEFCGELDQAESIHKHALALTADDQGRYLPVGAYPLAGLARVYRERHAIDIALDYARQSIAVSRPAQLGTPMLDGVITLARLCMAQGDYPGARAALQSIEEVIARRQIRVVDLRLDAMEGLLALAQDDLETACAWADQFVKSFGLDHAGNASDWYEVEYLILARIWIAAREFPRAAALLDALHYAAESVGRTARMVEILVLQALLHQRRQETDPALASLSRAVTLAQPAGLVRPFVDADPSLGELLARLALAGGLTGEYAHRLLRELPTPPAPTPASAASSTSPATTSSPNPVTPPASHDLAQWLAEPLSERELEVLALVAQGLTNRQVGERLYISVPTVKKHMENIHGKLYVRTRTQAVARARELGIL